ncbi:MAG: aminodeoxychorismate synthase component I [Dokdonella sp.]|uniref:aminodeoxychorismate synthase component I n=1 Tax=Dokdonella sp. TaxID=2291710 RepID=UPI0025C35272|nr:aminodeoxychorismate synthase component I [Dokdonella sp.]MBX3700866.1 aminodeoxychorismate synthase component I [Dokdonella sp.]MCW5578674.1 aminodeoxychorismate synthase component I [Dokdonella sp.]
MSPLVKEIAGVRDLLALAARFPARYPGLLESAARGSARAGRDLLLMHEGERLVLAADGGLAAGNDAGLADGFLAALDSRWRAARTTHVAEPRLPFHGGWLLYLGYELAAQLEPRLCLPPALEPCLPTALALRCPAAIIVDHARCHTMLVAEPGRDDLIAAMQADLAAAADWTPRAVAIAAIEEDAPQEFIDGVARVHEHLRAGDVFQVNLSRGWRARCAEQAVAADVYAALRATNPAPFAGLLQYAGGAVISSSPERLLEVRAEVVQTRPIAGTRPRQPGDDDAARIAELVGHVKERAEHVMLIDLERNDLGRICVPGSIVVDELMSVESYAHVHHIVSNVRGRLRRDITPGQAIAAVFPGGTITGCPKLRCMQIIAALETGGRGAYTGALGYLDRNGDLDLNILIRSLSMRGPDLAFRAGAGIVADSDPWRELDETRAKARGLLRALGV